jgi:hypothetical protein
LTAPSSAQGFRHGLAFLALEAFLASFFGSRLFAILNPEIVVVVAQGEIHFHHFWYGLALIAIAGWLGLTRRGERLDRIYAILYGIGAGFIGDEIGLLLTFNNYYSELTYVFFVAATSFVFLAMLLLRYGDRLVRDVFSIGFAERLLQFGIFITGFSAVFFAFGLNFQGFAAAGAGLILVLIGRIFEKTSFRFKK